MDVPSQAGSSALKRAALYLRFSPLDQHAEAQAVELREYARRHCYEVVEEYADHGAGGSKARRPALDRLLKNARSHRFDAVLVYSCDRLAKSTKHFLNVLEELGRLGVRFQCKLENIDTNGSCGRALNEIVSALTGLERSLTGEKVRLGLRRAQLEGRRIGRTPLNVDRAALVRERMSGASLTTCAKKFGVSRATIVRLVREAQTAVGGH